LKNDNCKTFGRNAGGGDAVLKGGGGRYLSARHATTKYVLIIIKNGQWLLTLGAIYKVLRVAPPLNWKETRFILVGENTP